MNILKSIRNAITNWFTNRYAIYYLATGALIGWMHDAYPAQVQVLLWKLCLLLVAITVGIHLSRAAIITPIEKRVPELLSDKIVSAAIAIARAIVIMACVIAMCLGV